jgi:hypothetical protein
MASSTTTAAAWEVVHDGTGPFSASALSQPARRQSHSVQGRGRRQVRSPVFPAIQDGLPSTNKRVLVADARVADKRARSLQREQIAAMGSGSSNDLHLALEIILARANPSPRERKVLLQIREVVDRLLEHRHDDNSDRVAISSAETKGASALKRGRSVARTRASAKGASGTRQQVAALAS